MKEPTNKELLRNILLELKLARRTNQTSAKEKQGAAWKRGNPDLSRSCRRANYILNEAYKAFLERLTERVMEDEEVLIESDFALKEVCDHSGQQITQINNLLVVLGQLSMDPETERQLSTERV